MELLSITCQHCSAPLQVPAGSKFVTCLHCGAQLAVRQTESAAYTETLETIDSRTERMAVQLEDLQRRSEVADLDRQWDADRERFYVTGKHGHRHLPTEGGSIVGGIVITIFGVIWTMIACGIGGAAFGNAPGPFGLIGAIFPLFGIAFIAFGLWNAFQSYNKASEYEKAQARYRRRREELLRDEDVEQEQAG
ncbi:MAG: hypothetical protein H0T47_17325 [Planctomycetaceae bacterium]|nr:hypothetical protein [Planctomycetaceae bacterium]